MYTWSRENGHNMHFMMTPDFDEKSSNFNERHTYTCTNTMCFGSMWPCLSVLVPSTFPFIQHSVRMCTFVFWNWFFAFANTTAIRPEIACNDFRSMHNCTSHVRSPVRSSKLHNLQSKNYFNNHDQYRSKLNLDDFRFHIENVVKLVNVDKFSVERKRESNSNLTKVSSKFGHSIETKQLHEARNLSSCRYMYSNNFHTTFILIYLRISYSFALQKCAWFQNENT